MLSRITRRLFAPVAAVLATLALVASASAGAIPSGETQLGQSIIQPAYNDTDGSLIYFLTPSGSVINANDHNTASFYVILYPTSAAASVGTVHCQLQLMDNCPDHGPILAGIAESAVPAVSGKGLWGYDHIFAAPASGSDFNVDWLPIAVLVTHSAAANIHITTMAQLTAAEASGDAFEIPLPPATFHCSVVDAAAYNAGTPVPTAPPVP